MSSFTMMMLGEGVEVELPTDLKGIISILDREVPYFVWQGHGYAVAAGKGTLGKRWDLIIRAVSHGDRKFPPVAIGRVELEKINGNSVQLRIPPRLDQDVSGADEHDRDGRMFGSFICQTLNTLQRHKLIDLPGVLPTV